MDKVLNIMKEGIEYPFLLEFLDEPSKRIRSKIALLYLKTAGKNLDDDIYSILAVGELIHNASLLHDDIIDEALLRRGKTPIGKKISPKISILAGDYLVSFAISKINNPEIIKIFQICTQKMCESEFKQFFMRGKIPSLNDYIDICKGKTGALFAAVLESCALLSGIDKINARLFGELYGLYFQIKNDMEEESAKSDKKNNIYTALSVMGIEKTLSLLDNLREEMRNLLGVFPESNYKQELEGLFKE